jgi:hypothetical protein
MESPTRRTWLATHISDSLPKLVKSTTANEVLLDLGTNTQPSEPKHKHAQRKLARLAACATPVRPMACAGQTGGTGQTGGQSRSGRWL